MSVPRTARRPILVTGSPRSGTTWVGHMLCAGHELTYISEPLNPENGSIPSVRPGRWFEVITTANQARYRPGLESVCRLAPSPLREVPAIRTPGDAARLGRLFVDCGRGRAFGRLALLKDPFASLSASWFHEQLGCKVVVVVRHPAAVVASTERLDWGFPVGDIVRRAHSEASSTFDRGTVPSARIDRIAVLWSMVYGSLGASVADSPDVHFVRHEDLCIDPRAGFRSLYDALGLEWNQSAERAVVASSGASHGSALPEGRPHEIRLDSQRSVGRWRTELATDQIRRIGAITGSLADRWYQPNSWDP